ncbi:MAG: hypothetical protein GF401_02860 [Chitinivibrionales bacterium]|nr:hypothetical protein [Chitinivibrionales bacterium]
MNANGEFIRTPNTSIVIGIEYASKGYKQDIQGATGTERFGAITEYLSFPIMIRLGYFHQNRIHILLIGPRIDYLMRSLASPYNTAIIDDLKRTILGMRIILSEEIVTQNRFKR